jgi:23S rRNA (guanosine2251-2'-O)-methyltransferase
MAGNSQRRGAVRRDGTKKGATVGTGGQVRKSLQGKGPTPSAKERPHHPQGKRARVAAKSPSSTRSAGGAQGGSSGGASAAGRSSSGGSRRKPSGGNEYVIGRNSVSEALVAGVPAKALLLQTKIDSDERIKLALKLAAERGVPLMEATKLDLDRLAQGVVHQGLILQVPPYEYADTSDLLEVARRSGRPPLIVALDGVTDPRNLGAVVRSAAAFGGHGVIVPARRAAGMTASAWKTSAGAAARVKVAQATNLTRALIELKQAGCFIAGLDAGGDVSLPDLDLATGPLVLVAGSEGKGLSRLVRETCDVVVSIPMLGGTESLNAGVAAGVALYEVARRRIG